MKMLIWKELREMGFWAALIAAGLALAEGFALYMTLAAHGRDYTYNPSTEIDAIYGYFKLWMQIGAPIAGFVLGMLQIVPEQRRDQWAFLLHRPVAPRTIFFAKAIAGVTLLLSAAGLPLIGITLWLSMPGNFPGPFPAVLTLPDVAAILAGIPFYFAGMLVALRPAKWWGSKLVPVACAVTGVLFAVSTPKFAYAVLVAVAYAVAMFFAALGSFISSGEYDGQSIGQRFALGVTVLVGVVAVAIAAGALCVAIATNLKPPVMVIGSQFALDKQYQLVQVLAKPYGGVERVYDVDGKPLADASTNQDDYDYGSGEMLILGQSQYSYSDYGSYESHFSVVSGFYGGNHLYDIYDIQNRVIDAFSIVDHRRVGYIGVNGSLCPTVSMAGPFPDRALTTMLGEVDQDQALLLFPNAIYALDNHEQRLRVFARPEDGTVFSGASIVWCRSRPGEVRNYVIALSGNIVSAYDTRGSTIATFPYAKSPEIYSSISVWIRPNPIRLLMLYENGFGASAAYYRQHPWRFVTIARPDTLVSDIAAYPMNVYIGDNQPGTGIRGQFVMILMPAALFAVSFALLAICAALGLVGWSSVHAQFHDPNMVWMMMWVSVGAVLSAMAVLGLARRYGWNRVETTRWTIAGAILSWPGILMLLAMIPFPQFIVCPSCGHKRIVSRTSCEHCGAAMPPPPRDGTEIFEAVETPELEEAGVG